MQYKHLFFDLDHTLWDFEANSKAALTSMYYDLDLRQLGILSPKQFVDVYYNWQPISPTKPINL